MLVPVGMAMLFRIFPPHERARAARVLIIPTAVAPALGPVLGGLLVDQASWRWVFFVTVPVGVAALLFGLRFLDESRADQVGSFDVGGFLLAGLGLGAVMYALSQGPEHGWSSAGVLGPGVTGIVLLAFLARHELGRVRPMLDLRLLRGHLFEASVTTTFVAYAALLGIIYAFTQFQQVGLGRSPLEAGLLTFPEAIGVMGASQIVARLYPHVGPRRLVAGGLCGIAACATLIGFQDAATPLVLVVLTMVALGASHANVFVALQVATFAQISGASMGQASSLYNATRQVGAAFGVAVLATVISTHHGASTSASGLGAYQAAFLVAAGVAVVGGLLGAEDPRRRCGIDDGAAECRGSTKCRARQCVRLNRRPLRGSWRWVRGRA